MIHTRIKIFVEVEVDLDNVPGWGHTPGDHVDSLRKLVEENWNTHYDPKLTVDHFEVLHKVTHGDEKWVFVDEQAAIDKQSQLLGPLLDSLRHDPSKPIGGDPAELRQIIQGQIRDR